VDDQAPSLRGTALVIGYGNPLRGDDAVGQRVASAVADWGWPAVEALAVHQLTPELAVPLASARIAIFVDARLGEEGEACHVRSIRPECPRATIGHISDPQFVLAIARAISGRQPPAWLITIPATDLTLGAGLSPAAASGMEAALRQIARLVGSANPAPQVAPMRPQEARSLSAVPGLNRP
jgi:hydrogenase maturation protease